MILDLHVHTNFSEDFDIGLEDVIRKARDMGLSGIMLTECDVVPDLEEVRAISERLGFPVFVGLEVNADDGRVLAVVPDPADPRFADQPWLSKEDLSISDVVEIMEELGGVAIAAHPYLDDGPFLGDRVFKTQGLTAIEVVCGVPGHLPNDLALEAAASLQLPTVGGSDSGPEGQRIGSYGTAFAETIRSQEHLVNALRSRSYWACTLRRPRRDGDRGGGRGHGGGRGNGNGHGHGNGGGRGGGGGGGQRGGRGGFGGR